MIPKFNIVQPLVLKVLSYKKRKPLTIYFNMELQLHYIIKLYTLVYIAIAMVDELVQLSMNHMPIQQKSSILHTTESSKAICGKYELFAYSVLENFWGLLLANVNQITVPVK